MRLATAVMPEEVLRCIRCGACLGSCPVYTKIGGYPYGWVYSGPIDQVLNPLLLGLDRTEELYRASTLCGNCKNVCPVGIDHPSLFLYFRSIDAAKDSPIKAGIQSRKESAFFALWARIITRISLWNLLLKIARPFINGYTLNSIVPKIRGPLNEWLKTRDLPRLTKKTFRDRWKQGLQVSGLRLKMWKAEKEKSRKVRRWDRP